MGQQTNLGPVRPLIYSIVADLSLLGRVVKGEKKAGGLIITPLPSTSNAAPGPSSSMLTIAPRPRPPSSQGSSNYSKRPPDKPNDSTLDKSDISVSAAAAKKAKGKGKGREVVAPTRQDLEVEEDVRRMDAERERLRVREVKAQSQATLTSEFKTPLLPLPSVLRRKQTGLASGASPTTPGGTTIDLTLPMPLRDTPTIDRNRAMRGEPVDRRRSSLSRRGKRASSSFEHTGIIREEIS
jgi:kinetochore protein Mis13/DSN1